MAYAAGRGGPTRRGFLAGSAATLAMAAMVSHRAHAGGQEQIKVGVVGCGRRGEMVARQMLNTPGPVALWALGDAFEDRLADFAGSFAGHERFDCPAERRFVGLDAYRAVIDSGIDLVLLTEPIGFKPRHIAYAVEQGVHVFAEKPIAVDPAGIRSVQASAQKADEKGLRVGVGLQRRHQPSYQETIQRLHDGAIGDLTYMRVYWNQGSDVHHTKRWPRESDWPEMTFQLRNWYYFDWLSGDHYVEQHIHNIDVACWVLDREPLAAQGAGGREVRISPLSGNIFDHHAVEFIFDDEIRLISHARQIPDTHHQIGEQVHGTRGWANVAGAQIHGEHAWQFDGPAPNPLRRALETLNAAIRHNETHNELRSAARSVMTGILGRMATYSGQMIRWRDAIASEREIWQDPTRLDQEPRQYPDEDGIYATAVPGQTQVL